MTEYTVRVYDNGNRDWFMNGQLHREDGPAIEWASGFQSWYRNGKRHREDGPAIEWSSGSKAWCLNGKLHREDGPAIEWSSGSKEWWLNDVNYTEEEFIKKTTKVTELTLDEIAKKFGISVDKLKIKK